jgi:hypothetical protein
LRHAQTTPTATATSRTNALTPTPTPIARIGAPEAAVASSVDDAIIVDPETPVTPEVASEEVLSPSVDAIVAVDVSLTIEGTAEVTRIVGKGPIVVADESRVAGNGPFVGGFVGKADGEQSGLGEHVLLQAADVDAVQF